MIKNQIIRLFEHAAWADSMIMDALQAITEPPEKAVQLFAHVLAAEKVWLTRLNEQDSSQLPIQ